MKQREIIFLGRPRKKSANCIAIVSLSDAPCRCPKLVEFVSLYRLNSIQTHEFFSISFLHQTEIHQSQFQNIFCCSSFFCICLQPKFFFISKLTDNYTMSIVCIVGYIYAKMPAMLKETDKLVLPFVVI